MQWILIFFAIEFIRKPFWFFDLASQFWKIFWILFSNLVSQKLGKFNVEATEIFFMPSIFISSRMLTYYILSYEFISRLQLRKKVLIYIINFFASTNKQWADFSKKIIYNIYQYLKNKHHVSFLKILEPRYLRPFPTNMEGARIFRKNVITM